MSTGEVEEYSEKTGDGLEIKVVASNTYIINIAPVKTNRSDMLDKESQHGRFGWITIDQKNHVPYIMRDGEKYCAVRMLEPKILTPYLTTINENIYQSCTSIQSYYITDSERRLLNEINSFHCEYVFGKQPFTQQDIIVSLNDATEFYKFLVECQKKLFNKNVFSGLCGFIVIDNNSIVPYVMYEGQKYFPLFYFEGAEHLQVKAKMLKGWHLCYLKFCYRIQAIREEFLKQETCAAVSMTDIKDCFPPNAVFRDFWPSSDATIRRFPINKGKHKPWYHLPTLQSANLDYLKQMPNAAPTT